MSLDHLQIRQFNEMGFLPYNRLLTPLETGALHQRLEDIGNQIIDFPSEYVEIEPNIVNGKVKAEPIRFNNVRKLNSIQNYVF